MVPRKNIFGARCSQAVLSALTRLMLVQEERGCRFIIFGWWGPGLTVTYWAYPRGKRIGNTTGKESQNSKDKDVDAMQIVVQFKKDERSKARLKGEQAYIACTL
eukprot:1152522-Pelagomonas_calceolata.AAC.6